MICVEKQGENGPCTHHVHAYLHYKIPVQLASVKKSIKNIVKKYHNFELDGSINASMMKTNTCYTYKDYLGKYEDTTHVTGDDFDVEKFIADMPDEAMQALLQAAVPTRPITTLWANHETK